MNSKLSTTGVFSVQNHNIQLKRGQSSYLLHELGHFVAALKGRADQTSEFSELDGIPDKKSGMGAVICMCPQPGVLRENILQLPVWYI